MRALLILGVVFLINCGGLDTYEYEEVESKLTVLTPAPGVWLDQDMIQVTGEAIQLEDVLFNETHVQTAGNGFFVSKLHPAHGINVFDMSGLDSEDNTHWIRQTFMAGPAAKPSEKVERALSVHLGSQGIQKGLGLIGNDFDSTTLETMVKTYNPIFDDRVEDVKVRADIQHLTFDAPIITANTTEGYLDFVVLIPNFWLYIDTDVHIIFEWDLDVEIGSDIYLSGRVAIEPTERGLDIQLDQTSAWLDAFYVNIDWIPNGIEERHIEPPLMQGIEEALNQIMTTMVPDLLADATEELDLRFDLPVGDSFTEVELGISEVDINKNGIDIAMSYEAEAPAPPSPVPGYLYAGEAPPSVDPHEELTVALSDNMVNQLMYTLWAGGSFTQRLSTDDETLPLIAGILFKSEAVTVEIDAPLPPVLIEHNGKLQMQIGDLDIAITTPGGEMGETLKMRVTALMDVDIALADSALKLKPTVTDTFMYVYDSDWGETPFETTALVEETLPMEVLLGLMGDLVIPMDALGDLGLELTLDVGRNPSGVHTDLAILLP